IKNKFYHEIQELYAQGAQVEQLKAHLGRARAKRGMFEGDLHDGELEIGQVSALIDQILHVSEVFTQILAEFHHEQKRVAHISF
ncbi:MAG: nitronate monooxygenase, partial [Flavobacterium sp.]